MTPRKRPEAAVTDTTPNEARAFAQVHQRLDGHEHRLRNLEVDAAKAAVQSANIDDRLSEIQSGVTWLNRLVIGGIVGGIVAFIIAGGLNVSP